MAAVTPVLRQLDASSEHVFFEPAKRINEGEDVTFFLCSKAYADIMTFLLQLNAALFPRKDESGNISAWEAGNPATEVSPRVQAIATMLEELTDILKDAPPDTGPRRFGNIAFRKWYEIAESKMDNLMDTHIPLESLPVVSKVQSDPRIELKTYLMGSFGSAQRLDYGSGHELSFLAFLGGLWKLGYFVKQGEGVEERAIVLNIFDHYLHLVRKLILTYTLEPAGSHGVWGLDDHSFIPYILGSAQLAAPITRDDQIPLEGSLPDAPDPGDVAKAPRVERLRRGNLYFGAIGFIYDVKKGPFWEHSPMLYDISGVKAGWAKINKGMIKMYINEVLSKFPVVQHFPFGSLFQWERDPTAPAPTTSAHLSNQPTTVATSKLPSGPGMSGTAAPWASTAAASHDPRNGGIGVTAARAHPIGSTRAPWATPGTKITQASDGQGMAPTKAPWSKR